MKYALATISIWIFALSTSIVHGQAAITDALQNFKSTWDLDGVTTIYKLEVDINNDGIKEVFLSTGKSDPPDVEELGWVLYIGKPGGQYVIANEKTDTGIRQNAGVSFKKDQYFLGFIPEIGTYGLLYLACGRGGQAQCQLHAITISSDSFTDTPIGQPVSAETNYATLAKRFRNPPVPTVQTLSP